MTRFDADDVAARRKLVADAVAAHRQRGSPYLTLSADEDAVADPNTASGDDDGAVDEDAADDGVGDDGVEDDGAAADGVAAMEPPWVQFDGGEGVLNLDCTDDELGRLEDLLGEFPAFKIRELDRPEGASGTNVRVGALADAARIAGFVDRVFREVYGLDEDFRLWVAEI